MGFTSDPEAPWCRACAGTGIAYDAPAWAIVLLREPVSIDEWIDSVTGRHRSRYARAVDPHAHGGGREEHWPFIRWLHKLEHLESIGAVLPDWTLALMERAGELLCMGCHGTGRFWYAGSYEKQRAYA